MFENMGIQWASTLLGCLAACLVPIPIGFYLYGKRLRMKSKFAPFFEPAAEAYAPEEETGEETEVAETS
jgi:DHA1 family multidrug resistance protein-like MFS transporter